MKSFYNVVVLQDTELIGVIATLAGSPFSKILNNNGDIHVLIYINIYDQKIYKRFIKS